MDEAANMIDMEKIDISLLVGNIVNEVSLELEEKHITVVNSLKPKIQLRGNYSLLYSIFRNLMDNAIAYAGTDIRINISCFREDENFYYFSFADTGVGVSPEHLNRLFERFYRVDKGRSRKLGGTGLGLAIVKNSVIIHGGTISAKNNQGGGLEFVFTLAKEKGIHTCLDTSGIMFPKKHTGTDQISEREISLTGISENMASDRMEKIEQLMSVTDLVMLDIKHINDEEHQKLTGQPNSNTCIPQQVYHCLALLSCMRRGYAPPPGTTPPQIPISSGAEGRSPMCSASPP